MADKIKSRSEWLFDHIGSCNIIEDKKKLQDQYIQYMLIRTQKMFEYENLPDTIPQQDLELLLQITGSATITNVDENLYAFYGGLGGELNTYYHPTISTVANPYLNFSKNLKIGSDCVVILNDPLYMGLTPMFNKYASILAETDISLRFASINARIPSLISADNDVAKKSAETFINDIIEGKKIGIIGSSAFFDGIRTEDYGSKTNQSIKDLIELHNYIESSWYMDLGIRSMWNNKRESLSSDETSADDDMLLPLIDEMLKQREMGVKRINDMYGTNISVNLSSSWKKLRDQMIQMDQEQDSKKEGDPDVIEGNNQ